MRKAAWFNRKGEPISLEEASKLAGNERYRSLEYTELRNNDDQKIWVSTIWMGMSLDDPPLIFETMVFGGKLARRSERYATEAEAETGHERWIAKVKEAEGIR